MVIAGLKNPSTGKVISDIEFLIDTGSQFSVVVPAFVADQLGLDESNFVQSFMMNTVDGSSVETPNYNVLLTINSIPIQTTVTVSGITGAKALIGAELLSLFDLEIRGDLCRLTLASPK